MDLGLWLPPVDESGGSTVTKSPRSPVVSTIASRASTSVLKVAKPGPLKRFTCSSRLPAEIRPLIWREFCQVPRVIRIEYDSRSGHCTAHQKKPPTGLRVSREAREETLSKYQLAFGTAQVFINLNADVLCMDNGTSNQGLRLEPTTCLRELLRHASHDDIRSIRSLAISCTEGA